MKLVHGTGLDVLVINLTAVIIMIYPLELVISDALVALDQLAPALKMTGGVCQYVTTIY